jgi:hypothetical protein
MVSQPVRLQRIGVARHPIAVTEIQRPCSGCRRGETVLTALRLQRTILGTCMQLAGRPARSVAGDVILHLMAVGHRCPVERRASIFAARSQIDDFPHVSVLTARDQAPGRKVGSIRHGRTMATMTRMKPIRSSPLSYPAGRWTVTAHASHFGNKGMA